MNRYCFTLNVRNDRLAEYRAAHENVWPDMLAALTEAGWSNYSLFLRDDGLLIGYFETEHTFDEAVSLMGATEVNERWQSAMAEFFVETRADEVLAPHDQVFFLP